MKNPQWQDRDQDELTGSPELFATNLLLVRALDNSLDRITVSRESDRITVQLFSESREFEAETLTEDTSAWTDIRERFERITDFSGEDESTGSLEPNIPVKDSVESIEARYEPDQIEITFQYKP